MSSCLLRRISEYCPRQPILISFGRVKPKNFNYCFVLRTHSTMANILREILEEQIQNTRRRDTLVANEQLQQQRWEELKAFEFDAPEDLSKPKFFATFPYPYMNGRLHLGHLFTISKADFVVYYQRMKGKQAIFPFSFHVTGMPIKACADKLKRELEQYGPGGPPYKSAEELAKEKEEIKKALLESMNEATKPDAKGEKGKNTKQAKPAPAPKKTKESSTPGEFHSKKSKAAAKSGGDEKPQWEIMRSIGISDDLIVKFTDPLFWLEYFPPHCQTDLKRIGTGIDWRRSFYTTVANPFYDRFVIWQFNQLKQKNKLDFGKRFAIYSPKDGQPCMDHDRASGETVLPQEYTLIKLEVQEPYPEKLQAFQGKFKVFLAAATLRPETMYGQTNCWILPTGEYGLYQINDTEAFVISARAARNLAFQEYSPVPGQECLLATISGEELLGVALKAPLAQFPVIYTLPMFTISMDKGTGVVTSVPSDSPDDYTSLRELKTKEPFRRKLNLNDDWVMPFDPVPILQTSKGDLCAPTVVEEMKIVSPKDRDNLEKAKETCYKLGFYEGVLLVGEHAGQKVESVKDKIREALFQSGQAIKYAEPANKVVSRSGDVCVVALTDQWFLTYGEPVWKKATERALEKLDTYNDDTKHQFAHTLDWLHGWACSRTYGLGSKLPWDQNYLIESLSDSTIYMAYYTIAHLIQGGAYDGSKVGPAGIKPEQLTDDVFNYIFLNSPYPASTDIPEETLKQLRREFEYWYPLNLRVSGKDLIPNHLTFMLYNHTAIWDSDESKWPLGVRGNGHLLLNNKKMSKQTGNFLAVFDSLDLFGADATRIALAHAGDSFDDANFSSSNANKAVLDLFNALTWAEEILSGSELKTREEFTIEDRTFDSVMNTLIKEADHCYDRMLFQKALIYAFYELRSARDHYRLRVGADNMNRQLIVKFIEVQALMMVPITPHWSEKIWQLLGKQGLAVHQPFPEPGPIDDLLVLQDTVLAKLVDDFRKKLNSSKARKPVKGATIFVATGYPEWHTKTVQLIEQSYNANSGQIDVKALTTQLKSDPSFKKFMNFAVPLVKQVADQVAVEGPSALDLRMPYDEKQFLSDNLSYISRTLEIPITLADDNGKNKVVAVPKAPTILFEQ